MCRLEIGHESRVPARQFVAAMTIEVILLSACKPLDKLPPNRATLTACDVFRVLPAA